MARALAVSIIVAIVIVFAAVGDAQPTGSNQYGEGSAPPSWEMYRQQQVEMQLELQRQQLEMQRQQLEMQRQRLEVQQQQLEVQQQRLEVQRQQHRLELDRQRTERQKKQME